MIRANAVEVDKLFRARCRIEGCGWTGELRGTYVIANSEREMHLAEHRASECSGTREG